ncbi:MAG: Gfo/Idh/MocA family protein [Acidimicrobiia bacterium]
MVSIGVIGLGFMGSKWARALSEHPAAELTLVSDLRQELGRELAATWGAEYVHDPLEAAAHPHLDGVVVATPEHAHVDLALAALEAGKTLAVEKPLAHTVEDAELIRDRATHLDLPVLVGHILRFEPRYAAIRRAIESGEIGSVQAVRSERIGLVSDQDILQGRTSIALYYGVHEFDLARWYAGEVSRIYAERSQGVVAALGYQVEDLYSATLRFADGAHGTAMVGWSLPPAIPGWGLAGFTVIGEEAVVRVSQGELGFTKVTRDGVAHEDVHYAPEVHGRLFGALGIEVDHFVRCAQGAATPLCTADDGVEAVRISLAMVTSAEKGEPVDLAGSLTEE